MKRVLALGLMALTLGPVAAVGASLPASASATLAQGEAELVPVPREFVRGPLTTVRGEVELRDTGSALIVKGEAEHLDPAQTYVSLAYTTPATGPSACLPGPPLTFTQMFLGTWEVTRQGHGRLRATKTAAGNTSPTPASLQAAIRFLTGAPSGDLSGPGAYVALTPAITSVSIRVMTPVADVPVPLPDRIDCGALHVEQEG